MDTRFDNLSSASGRNALEMDGFLLFDVRGQVISLRSGIATDIANNEKFSTQSNKLFYFTSTKISIFCDILMDYKFISIFHDAHHKKIPCGNNK